MILTIGCGLVVAIALLLLQWFFVVGFPTNLAGYGLAIGIMWPLATALVCVFRVLPSLQARAFLISRDQQIDDEGQSTWHDAERVLSRRYIDGAARIAGKWWGL